MKEEKQKISKEEMIEQSKKMKEELSNWSDKQIAIAMMGSALETFSQSNFNITGLLTFISVATQKLLVMDVITDRRGANIMSEATDLVNEFIEQSEMDI